MVTDIKKVARYSAVQMIQCHLLLILILCEWQRFSKSCVSFYVCVCSVLCFLSLQPIGVCVCVCVCVCVRCSKLRCHSHQTLWACQTFVCLLWEAGWRWCCWLSTACWQSRHTEWNSYSIILFTPPTVNPWTPQRPCVRHVLNLHRPTEPTHPIWQSSLPTDMPTSLRN